MNVLTFEEFRASGRDCRLEDEFPGMEFQVSEYGRAYADSECWIERTADGWYLIIERSEYTSKDLVELEKILYEDWYLTEIVGGHVCDDDCRSRGCPRT